MNSFLTPRLLKIAELVDAGASVIDVGTDHAYVPIYLCKENKALRALATDINEGPLRRADENIACFGLENRIRTKKANGLCGVDMSAYDTVIIAGMGGILISEILSGADTAEGKIFILQPMTAAFELRQYLSENAFLILEEHIVQEEEKLYTIMKVKKGTDTPYSAKELLLGRKSIEDPLYPILVSREKKKLCKKLSGKKRAKERDEKEIQEIINLIEEMGV